jgi:exosortase H (IPTLxxWG-CTERM-specific)
MVNLRRLWARPESRFLIVFLALLIGGFFVIALQPVNDAVVVPFTAGVAAVSGTVLQLFEDDLTVVGCDLRSPRFAVTIYNGCNGLITSLIFVAGVLAFPARIRAKAIGVVVGLIAIQLVNLVRIVALFYTGVYLPDLFDESHLVVWQSIVILFGVALWITWARLATRTTAERNPTA